MRLLDRYLENMQKRLERSKPCKITVTFADGSTTVTDPVGAIRIFREHGPFGAIAGMEADRPEYEGLICTLSAVCK